MNRITIVTAVFNSTDTIIDCLESVRLQTYANIEHVIIDGESIDGTLEYIKEFNNPNLKLFSEIDCGIYDAINKGIKRSSGDIVGLLHSDDVFYDKDIVGQVAKLFEDPEVDLVYCDLEYVSKSDLNKVIRFWKSGSFNVNKLRFGWMPPHPTVFVRNSVFKNIGFYNLDYKIAADYEFLLRVLTKENIGVRYCPVVAVKMRVGGASNGKITNIVKKMTEDLEIAGQYFGFPSLTVFMKNFQKIGQFILPYIGSDT